MPGLNTTRQSGESVAVAEVIDDKTLMITEMVINCILVNIIAVIGSVGNVINMLVLTRHGFTDSTNVLLMSVTVADLIFLLSLLLRRINCLVARIDQITALTFEAIVSAYLWIPNRYFGIVSSVFVVIISIERFVAVYFPLSVSVLFSPRKVYVTVAGVCVIWFGLMAPLATSTVFVWTFSAEWNTTVGQTVYGSWFMENYQQLTTLNLMLSVARGPVSVVIILGSSVSIGVRLRAAGQKRRKMTTKVVSNKVDVRVVKMLLVVCLIYAAVAIPLSAPYILYNTRPDLVMQDGQLTNFILFLECFSDLLYVVNASVNFLIYVTMSAKFYKTYISLFSCCKKHD